MENLITIDKAVNWLYNNVYAGFDSMCLSFENKTACIEKFIADMKNENYGVNDRDYYDY